MTLSTESTTKLLKVLNSVVESIEDSVSKASIEKLIEENAEALISAPASHKADYHNCFPCGLLDHTLRVYVILKDLKNKYDKNNKISNDSLIKVALLHDLGKIGDETGPYYTVQESQWHRETLGNFYQINDGLTFMTPAHRSVYLAQRYSIPLTKEEFQAIMIHDGQYTETNKAYCNRECLLANLLHLSDMLATVLEKERYNEFVVKEENRNANS